jgi:site-specific DNA-methyltransferase (adenine-specific)
MSSNQYARSSQPDVLEVIANLSNDAVFTPPRVVNAVLDLLPQHVWSDPSLRWLDPGSKTGVFPREVTKRLMVGLAGAIPDEKKRLNHILANMVFAIATEEVTAMMSRRSLYCSKDASSEISAAKLTSPSGNVWHKRVKHSFDAKGRCTECGGTKAQLEEPGRDNRAYGFIHEEGRNQIAKEIDMKFDVVVGNPPYQMETGGSGRQAVPIYQHFVAEAMKLNPKYLAMIIPSRWFAGGLGLDVFRREMLGDRRIRKLVDYLDVRDCFPGVDLAGGVCYFLWDRDSHGECEIETRWSNQTWSSKRLLDEFDVFVRMEPSVEILRTVLNANERTIIDLVSGVRPFGLATSERPDKKGELNLLSSGGNGPLKKSRVLSGHEMITKWKVITSKASHDHGGQPDKDGRRRVLSKTEVMGPGWVCTESYIVLGAFSRKSDAENYLSYVRTRFVRFLISLRSLSQDITRDRFAFVPKQDFSRAWSDKELYEKYGLSQDQIEFVESVIKEMPA